MSKVGRTSKYFSHVQPRLDYISELAKQGCTNKEIAHALGVGLSNFSDYLVKYPELVETLQNARIGGVVSVKQALLKKALGFEYEEVKTSIRKNEDGSETKYTERVKRYAQPDSNAINMYLRNYDKEWLETDRITQELKEMELKMRKELLDDEMQI